MVLNPHGCIFLCNLEQRIKTLAHQSSKTSFSSGDSWPPTAWAAAMHHQSNQNTQVRYSRIRHCSAQCAQLIWKLIWIGRAYSWFTLGSWHETLGLYALPRTSLDLSQPLHLAWSLAVWTMAAMKTATGRCLQGSRSKNAQPRCWIHLRARLLFNFSNLHLNVSTPGFRPNRGCLAQTLQSTACTALQQSCSNDK